MKGSEKIFNSNKIWDNPEYIIISFPINWSIQFILQKWVYLFQLKKIVQKICWFEICFAKIKMADIFPYGKKVRTSDYHLIQTDYKIVG